MSVVPISLCSLFYVKSVSSNIPKHFSAVSSSDPFIVGLSSINIMYNGPSFWLPFADWGQAPWWMQGLLPKKTSAGQNGSSATNFNKPSPSVFLSVEFVCWHPYKSQVQHFEEFKTLKKMLLNNMLDFLNFTISAFLNNFWLWRSFQVTVLCPLLW